jgi:hypothetical protein
MSTTRNSLSTETEAYSNPIEPDQETEPDTVSDDDVFELLSNQRRRYVLLYLRGRETVKLGELARQIAAWENETSRDLVTAAERKRVYSALQQFHLPKMDDMGVIQYDSRNGIVEHGPVAASLDIYLEVVTGNDIPWNQYYLGLTAVNAALLAAVAVDTLPLVLVPDLGWGVFVLTSFAVSVLFHTYCARTEMRLENLDEPPEMDQ